jgi:NAD(P)-dependent dehydrogenase (short-subunit alcohol dehydrogenase family)
VPLTRDLADSTVVITGGSGGIGAATALRLARRGAAVVVGARREGATADVVAACRAGGGRAIGVRVDVTDPAAVEALGRRAVEEFGRLDAWVNNAAVAAYGTFTDVPIDEFRRVIETNLLGAAYGTRTAITHLRATGGGVIVNLASVLGEVTVPYLSGYNTTKHGVRALS